MDNQKSTQLLDYEVDVAFYDVTSFYFDIAVEEVGVLRQKVFGSFLPNSPEKSTFAWNDLSLRLLCSAVF